MALAEGSQQLNLNFLLKLLALFHSCSCSFNLCNLCNLWEKLVRPGLEHPLQRPNLLQKCIQGIFSTCVIFPRVSS